MSLKCIDVFRVRRRKDPKIILRLIDIDINMNDRKNEKISNDSSNRDQ